MQAALCARPTPWTGSIFQSCKIILTQSNLFQLGFVLILVVYYGWDKFPLCLHYIGTGTSNCVLTSHIVWLSRTLSKVVLRIRIRRIHMFLGLPNPDSLVRTSVADQPDPHVFGPPGSTSQRYGSGSFCHHAKIVRKTLIPTIL